MLIYMFYFVPFYALTIYGILYPSGNQKWMKDWSLIFAGAAAQVCFANKKSYLT